MAKLLLLVAFVVCFIAQVVSAYPSTTAGASISVSDDATSSSQYAEIRLIHASSLTTKPIWLELDGIRLFEPTELLTVTSFHRLTCTPHTSAASSVDVNRLTSATADPAVCVEIKALTVSGATLPAERALTVFVGGRYTVVLYDAIDSTDKSNNVTTATTGAAEAAAASVGAVRVLAELPGEDGGTENTLTPAGGTVAASGPHDTDLVRYVPASPSPSQLAMNKATLTVITLPAFARDELTVTTASVSTRVHSMKAHNVDASATAPVAMTATAAAAAAAAAATVNAAVTSNVGVYVGSADCGGDCALPLWTPQTLITELFPNAITPKITGANTLHKSVHQNTNIVSDPALFPAPLAPGSWARGAVAASRVIGLTLAIAPAAVSTPESAKATTSDHDARSAAADNAESFSFLRPFALNAPRLASDATLAPVVNAGAAHYWAPRSAHTVFVFAPHTASSKLHIVDGVSGVSASVADAAEEDQSSTWVVTADSAGDSTAEEFSPLLIPMLTVTLLIFLTWLLEPAAANAATAAATTAPVKERLLSLDVLRGITLAVMVFVNAGAAGYEWLEHAPWYGTRFADYVFPFFVMMMGAAAALGTYRPARAPTQSAAADAAAVTDPSQPAPAPAATVTVTLGTALSLPRPAPSAATAFSCAALLPLLRRGLTLLLIGLFLANPAKYRTFRFAGVLQRFAIAYVALAVMLKWVAPGPIPAPPPLPAATHRARPPRGDCGCGCECDCEHDLSAFFPHAAPSTSASTSASVSGVVGGTTVSATVPAAATVAATAPAAAAAAAAAVWASIDDAPLCLPLPMPMLDLLGGKPLSLSRGPPPPDALRNNEDGGDEESGAVNATKAARLPAASGTGSLNDPLLQSPADSSFAAKGSGISGAVTVTLLDSAGAKPIRVLTVTRSDCPHCSALSAGTSSSSCCTALTRAARLCARAVARSCAALLAELWAFRWQVFVALIVLPCLWLALAYVAAPAPCPRGYLGPGGLWAHRGRFYPPLLANPATPAAAAASAPLVAMDAVSPAALCTGGAVKAIDVAVFTEQHIFQHPTSEVVYGSPSFEPEGVMGSLTTVSSAYIGVMLGRVAVFARSHRARIVRWAVYTVALLLLTALLLVGGRDGAPSGAATRAGDAELLLWGWLDTAAGVLGGVSKNTWSPAFVTLAGAVCAAALALCYVVVDAARALSGKPFVFLGMNSIVVFVAHGLLASRFPFAWTLYDSPTSRVEVAAQNTLAVTAMVALTWVLYRKKVFISV